MSDQDYYIQSHRETRADAVQRINEERGLYQHSKGFETPEQAAERRERDAEYLAMHDRYFGLGPNVSVGDPDGNADIE